MSTSSTWNPYQVLGVCQTASDAEIKSAFRRLAKETHPDLHGNDPDYVIRFRDITEAYEILSDPEKRKEYNMSHSEHHQGAPAQEEHSETYQTTNYNTQRSAYDYATYMQKVHAEVAPYKEQALKALFVSILWLALGIGVTAVSYTLTSPGGRFTVAAGAILFGGWETIKNLIKFVQLEIAISKYVSGVKSSFNPDFNKKVNIHQEHETYEEEEHVEFVVVGTDKCAVCGKMKPVNENGVCEECFRIVYK